MQQGITIGYSDLQITASDVFAALGYGTNAPNEDVSEAVNEVIHYLSSQVRPVYFFQSFEGEWQKDAVTIDGIEFHIGKIIATQLKKSERFALFAATAGKELSEYIRQAEQEGNMLAVYIADTIGSMVAERTADRMEETLYKEISLAGYKYTNRFSPGYCGWQVSEQQSLFSLLPPGVCGITLTASSLMLPVKSVSGIIGIGKDVSRKEYTCNLCDYKNCYKRKASSSN